MMLTASMLSLTKGDIGEINPDFRLIMKSILGLGMMYISEDFNTDDLGYLMGIEDYLTELAKNYSLDVRECMLEKFKSKGFEG